METAGGPVGDIRIDGSGLDLAAALDAKRDEVQAAAPGLFTTPAPLRPSRWAWRRRPFAIRLLPLTRWDEPDDPFFGYRPAVLPGESAWRHAHAVWWRVRDALTLSRFVLTLRRRG